MDHDLGLAVYDLCLEVQGLLVDGLVVEVILVDDYMVQVFRSTVAWCRVFKSTTSGAPSCEPSKSIESSVGWCTFWVVYFLGGGVLVVLVAAVAVVAVAALLGAVMFDVGQEQMVLEMEVKSPCWKDLRTEMDGTNGWNK